LQQRDVCEQADAGSHCDLSAKPPRCQDCACSCSPQLEGSPQSILLRQLTLERGFTAVPVLNLSGGHTLALGSAAVKAAYLGSELKHFNPKAINGLAAWWDADDDSTITTDTGVSAWVDKANGYTLSQSTGANQPTLSTINGRQAFDFNGSSQLLSSTDAGLVAEGATASGVNATTIFYVAEFDAALQSLPVAWGSSSNETPVYSALHILSNNLWRTFYRDSSVQVVVSSTEAFSTATPYIVATQTDSNIVGRVNGSQVVTASVEGTSGSLAPTQLAVGALLRSTATSFVNGRIGDVLIYNRVLTTAESQSVERWLAAKFGVTL